MPLTHTSVLEDPVFNSTTLAKQTSMVLDQADKGVVTITRNNEAYAIFNREQASWLVKANKYLGEACYVLAAGGQCLSDSAVDQENPCQWVASIDTKHLKEMLTEITSILAKAASDDSQLEELDAVIYEWHRSAIAAADSDLRTAFQALNEAIPLPSQYARPA